MRDEFLTHVLVERCFQPIDYRRRAGVGRRLKDDLREIVGGFPKREVVQVSRPPLPSLTLSPHHSHQLEPPVGPECGR
jgi:hypothetical protein